MRVLVLYAHPVPESFGAALRDTVMETLAASGHEVRLVDLNAIGLKDYGVLLAATFIVLLVVVVPYIALASRARLLLRQPRALQRLNRIAAGILAGTAAYIATRAA